MLIFRIVIVIVQNVTMKRNNVVIKRDRSFMPHVGSTLTLRSSDISWHRVTQAWYCPSVIIIRPPIKRVRAPVFRSFILVTSPCNLQLDSFNEMRRLQKIKHDEMNAKERSQQI